MSLCASSIAPADAALAGRAWALAAEKGISLAEACREVGLMREADGIAANEHARWHPPLRKRAQARNYGLRDD